MSKNNNTQQQLPCSIESEKLVLGTIMSERDAYSEIKELINEDCFYSELHKEVFRAIKTIVERGDRPDFITVHNEMRKTNPDANGYEISQIAICNTYDVAQHAAILFDKSIRRKLFVVSNYLSENTYSENEDIVDVIEEAKNKLETMYELPQSSIKTIFDTTTEVYNQIEKNIAGGTKLTGTDTGFPEFNKISGGLQKSDLIIIAGESSQGKTAFTLSMVRNMALSGSNVAIYSLEMRNVQLTARLLAMETGIPSNQILYSPLQQYQVEQFDKRINPILKTGIFFDDRSSSNIDTIISSIRSMKIKNKIEGAVIDYLQILNVNMKGVNKEQQMADVARRLKNLAKELDIWIIALSQLNRDSQNPVPSLNRLRDSGQIAEAADIVMFVYRPEVYGRKYPDPYANCETIGTAMIDIAKGRSIGIMRFICSFKKEITLFSSIDDLSSISSGSNRVVEAEPF